MGKDAPAAPATPGSDHDRERAGDRQRRHGGGERVPEQSEPGHALRHVDHDGHRDAERHQPGRIDDVVPDLHDDAEADAGRAVAAEPAEPAQNVVEQRRPHGVSKRWVDAREPAHSGSVRHDPDECR